MDRPGQTTYMERDPVEWRKDGFRRESLLSLRSQPTEREGKRGLTLTSKDKRQKLKRQS